MKILIRFEDGKAELSSSVKRALTLLEKRGIIKDWWTIDGSLRILFDTEVTHIG